MRKKVINVENIAQSKIIDIHTNYIRASLFIHVWSMRFSFDFGFLECLRML